MDAQSRDTVTFVLASMVSLCILVGLATRYILVPYLRDNLMKPVAETHKQVTENHHADDDNRTVLDRIDDVAIQVKAVANVMDVHMDWSEKQVRSTDRRLRRLKGLILRYHPDAALPPSDDPDD